MTLNVTAQSEGTSGTQQTVQSSGSKISKIQVTYDGDSASETMNHELFVIHLSLQAVTALCTVK